VADINLSFEADGGISLDDAVGIFTGTNDPSIGVGEAAPIGSLWIRQNGQLYQKIGALDTDWIVFDQGSGETVKISATDTNAEYLTHKLLVSSNLTKTINNAGGNETITLDLSNTGVSAGVYNQVTVDAKGRITFGANPAYLLANQQITVSGDATGSGTVAIPLTLATVNSSVGSFTNANITVNAKGLVTAASDGYVGAGSNVGLWDAKTNGTSGDPGTGHVLWNNNNLNAATSLNISTTTSGGVSVTSYFDLLTAGNILYLQDKNDATVYQRWLISGITPHTNYYTFTGSLLDNSTNFDSQITNNEPLALMFTFAGSNASVTSVSATAPAEGFTISGSPITTTGNFVFTLADDLAGLEGLTTTGISVRTGTSTWATRTLQGTADRLSITDGDGIATNPVLDIASTYAGQASINTLGTVTTGTWAATPVGTAFGGTGRTTIGFANQLLGVNTTVTGLEYKTLSADPGISLSFGGGYIIVGNTGVLSVTGTANQVITTGPSGSITLSLPQSIGTTSTPHFAQVLVTADPTLPLQVATKQYVDNLAQGLDAKAPVRAATTTNVTLSGEQTVDGIALVTGDRVLVKNQTAPAENGIYLVDTSSWTRTLDVDAWTEVPSAFTFVEEGAIWADTGWLSIADQGGTLGTTAMPWVQFSSAGVILAGTGLTKTGNTLSITNTGVTAGAGYNFFTVNAQGQITAASTQPYLLGNQNITLQGDVTGTGTTLINTTLSATGVTPSTYTSVTVTADGRVTAGTNPTTLAGYGIVDAQPLDADLTAIAAFTTTGFAVRTGANAWAQRVILAGSAKVAVTNGDGIAGNPTIDVDVSQININGLANTPLTIVNGGTNLTSLGTANQVLGVNASSNALEYKTFTSSGITITHTANGIDFSADTNGTVTSVAVAGSTGISVSGSPITSSGTINLTLDTELVGLTSPTGLGLVARIAAGTYVERTVVSGAATIAITNPAGTAGNISVDLANIGTSGTYTKITTDNFGRVTSGTSPTTLAGYGIVDAQPLNSYLTNLAGTVGTGIVVKNGNTNYVRSVVAGSSKITVMNGDGVAGNPTVDVGTLYLNSDLADVIVTAPANGQALLWNGTTWHNGSVALRLYAEDPVAEVTPVAVGDNSVAFGSEATASAHDSIAMGRQSLSRLPGVVQANGRFASQGDAQHGTYVLRTGTINGIPAELFFDGTNGSERLQLTTDTTWVWKATIVAHRTDADDHAGFELAGVTYCGASLNSIAMLGTVTKTILARSDSTLNVAAAVDTATGSIKLTVTSATGKTIRWTAVVSTTEVTN
jgi:hypothetical protein